jgi:hypothetical protein
MTAILIEEARRIHENAHLSDDALPAPPELRQARRGHGWPEPAVRPENEPNASLSCPRSSSA